MMSKWSEEPMHTPDQLNKYMFEPIMSLQELEQFLRQQQTGLQMELAMKEKQYRCRIDGIRNHTSMRIEALESALIETKIKLSRERERAEMRQAEMESTQFNQALNSEQCQRVDDIFKTLNESTFEEIDDVAKVKMMRTMIQRLRKCNDSLTTEKTQLAKELKELKDDVT
mmetsp:Transcript_885/g.1341  ORF Transcript_885/g.1341 Transcript_885/m.1341 type:complete len:170 (-) Transcript_885:1978-2487(-)